MITHNIEFTAYEVTECYSSEGNGVRDSIRLVGYFNNWEDATACEKLDNRHRCSKKVRVVETYDVYESITEFLDAKNGDKRKAALAKLTNEEKELLGLS